MNESTPAEASRREPPLTEGPSPIPGTFATAPGGTPPEGMARARAGRFPRPVLQGTAVVLALSLFPLWMGLIHYVFAAAGNRPAPAILMLPILYFCLAVWAIVAAVRDDGVVLALAGGLSFVPVGLFLLFMPGFAPWIGLVNLALVAIGVLLLRTDPGAEA